jgi:hypothetical protein
VSVFFTVGRKCGADADIILMRAVIEFWCDTIIPMYWSLTKQQNKKDCWNDHEWSAGCRCGGRPASGSLMCIPLGKMPNEIHAVRNSL